MATAVRSATAAVTRPIYAGGRYRRCTTWPRQRLTTSALEKSASPATATRNGAPRRNGKAGGRRHRIPASSQGHPPCPRKTPANESRPPNLDGLSDNLALQFRPHQPHGGAR